MNLAASQRAAVTGLAALATASALLLGGAFGDAASARPKVGTTICSCLDAGEAGAILGGRLDSTKVYLVCGDIASGRIWVAATYSNTGGGWGACFARQVTGEAIVYAAETD
jgi:hypothetical protein